MPTAADVRALYRAFLRQGELFPQYNIREYIKRRAREGFEAQRKTTQPEAIEAAWKKAKEDLEVAKRQAVVYSLFSRPQKSVMEQTSPK
ncbi:hypothetical protein BSKO_05236 [Bryopsis sp. KO-2023]|nr:hypothetical protein BSKO_05236 [Bryopsis sp. KO-2023]